MKKIKKIKQFELDHQKRLLEVIKQFEELIIYLQTKKLEELNQRKYGKVY